MSIFLKRCVLIYAALLLPLNMGCDAPTKPEYDSISYYHYASSDMYMYYVSEYQKIVRVNMDGSNRMLLFYDNDVSIRDIAYYRGWLYYKDCYGDEADDDDDGLFRMREDGSQKERVFADAINHGLYNFCFVGDYIYYSFEPFNSYLYDEEGNRYIDDYVGDISSIEGFYRVNINNIQNSGELLFDGDLNLLRTDGEHFFLYKSTYQKRSFHDIFILSLDDLSLRKLLDSQGDTDFDLLYAGGDGWLYFEKNTPYVKDNWIRHRYKGIYRISMDGMREELVYDYSFMDNRDDEALEYDFGNRMAYIFKTDYIYAINIDTHATKEILYPGEVAVRVASDDDHRYTLRACMDRLWMTEEVRGEVDGEKGWIERNLWCYDTHEGYWAALERDAYRPDISVRYSEPDASYRKYVDWVLSDPEPFTR